ncbi:ABC transporter substrate-binding protein, putative [Babesia ovata]|uniref:ABC transporter substrate-binding protein, putative n=1 Tax=Babesia ovata TaxID=189622 RepID=A0A2H6KE14_9APIC|nr:ABC transporter substrate-binding protein, putative [Babesia ovata]GBE61240.1 ABC transporter substrate-binding protein, putative [Babesia ovata]
MVSVVIAVPNSRTTADGHVASSFGVEDVALLGFHFPKLLINTGAKSVGWVIVLLSFHERCVEIKFVILRDLQERCLFGFIFLVAFLQKGKVGFIVELTISRIQEVRCSGEVEQRHGRQRGIVRNFVHATAVTPLVGVVELALEEVAVRRRFLMLHGQFGGAISLIHSVHIGDTEQPERK